MTDTKAMLKRLECKIDDLLKSFDESNVKELTYLLGSRKQMIIRNLIAGISRGIGTAIGFTILGAIIIYFLQKIVTMNIPLIGDYLADIAEIIDSNKTSKP